MYRLLKFSNFSNNNQHLLTTSIRSIATIKNLCVFCQKYRNGFVHKESFRYQSTISRNLLLQSITKKKKRIRRSRKYAEIVEVTSKCATEAKAAVTNLNAKHLALLTKTKFDIKLDELHKIKNPQNQISKYSSCTKENVPQKIIPQKIDFSTTNCNIIEKNTFDEPFPNELLHEHLDSFSTSKELSNSELLDDPEIQNGFIEELKSTEHPDNFDVSHIEQTGKNIANSNKYNLNKKELTKLSKRKKAELKDYLNKLQVLDKKAKQESLSRILLAYCGLCVAHDKPNRGLQALFFYINRAKRNPNVPTVTNVKVYNCLLEGFAAKANYSKVGEVLSIMKKENIKPDIQTFVAIFECLGRLSEDSSMKLLESYHKEILSRGFKLNDLMDNGKFTGDQRETVLEAIRRLQPNFVPFYTKPKLQYTCNLLKALNHADQEKILNDPCVINEQQNNGKIFLNTNINQLENNFFTDIKNKSSQEIRNEQLHSNLLNILKKYSIQLTMANQNNSSDRQYSCTNFNTYHSLSTNISVFTESQYLNYLNMKNDKLNHLNAPQSLQVIERRMASDRNLFTVDELKERAKQQMIIEKTGFIMVNSVEKQKEPSEIVSHFRTKLEEIQNQWEKVIKSCIKRDLASLQSQTQATGGANGAPSLHACLQALPIDELSQIVLQEVRKLAEGSETYSPTLSQLYRELGQVVHSRYQVKVKKQTGVLDKIDRIYEKYCEWYANYYRQNSNESNKHLINPRHYWQALSYNDQNGPSIDIEDKVWPHTMIVAVGKFLYNIITKDLKIDVNCVKIKSKQSKPLPAFYTLFRNQGHVVKEEIKAHPVVTRLFRGAAIPQIAFQADTLPMFCPPRPWANFNTGGYLVVNTEMLRLPPQAAQQIRRIVDTPIQNLYPSFDSLNQLAAVPWKVNEEILDVVLEIFRNGGNASLGVAPPADTYPNPPPIPPNATKSERFQAFRQRMIARRRKAEMYSLWCDALYRLSLANHFRKQIFWLPHNMDFRGRVYPVPPHLTHLGADLARSLLVFAEEKPLGADGLNWLKLHLINLLGTKKRNSIDERLEYANEMMDNILDSADNPLTGRMWWAESEEPWQTLACCKEIANAVRMPDPTKYQTRFPVHQDGSCNGLQHYAALGRDAAGAKSVNLTPSEYPQDVYSDVAVLVEKQRQKDADAGVKIAEILDGYVRRKVIKQTVMTTVYGVTRFGARLQIAKQLKDIDDFPKDHVWQASSYLTAKTFESLRTMFTSTKEIQDWLTECARFISGTCSQNVEWITPLGLPIVQPYNRYRKIEANLPKNKIAEHYAMDMFERPNVMKQKNAFPPNFIHSLDSSHMMLTSINCERAGITFVSVHDCFWTHPSTVHIMNKICREQFVSLHKEPILENLSEFLCDVYLKNDESKGTINNATKIALRKLLRKLPETGDFNLESVLRSVYFFS